MQDKIDEIINLMSVFEYDIERAASLCSDGNDDEADEHYCLANKTRSKIKSKLRELVREPLSEKEIDVALEKTEDESDYGHYDRGFFKDFTRNIERTHNITNTSREV